MAATTIGVKLPATLGPADKHWVKILSGVDPAAKDGFGFHGSFAIPGTMINEPPEGTLVLEGSRQYELVPGLRRKPKVVSVQTRNKLFVYDSYSKRFRQFIEMDGRDWAFYMRGIVADLLPKRSAGRRIEPNPEVKI